MNMMNLLTNGYLMGDVWSNIQGGANSLSNNLNKIAWAIFAVAVVIAGIMWVMGGQTAQMAKSTMGRVVIGVALVALASALVLSLGKMLGGRVTGINETIAPFLKQSVFTLFN